MDVGLKEVVDKDINKDNADNEGGDTDKYIAGDLYLHEGPKVESLTIHSITIIKRKSDIYFVI